MIRRYNIVSDVVTFCISGHILRVEVKVDDIRSLQIVTKTHELLLDEAPEEFKVRAYDAKGNEFSTLDGIIFKWDAKERDDVVKFISFRDSAYDFDYAATSKVIEAKGQQGYKVLLEGIKTGSSKISVRLVSKVYSEGVTPAADTTVVVVANLYIVPMSTYIMVGGTIDYKAEQMKSNKVHEISLKDSRQYYLEIKDGEKATKLSDTRIQGNAVGTTEVILQDKNVDATLVEEGVPRPSGELHVVVPDRITLDIDPHRNWMVIVGNHYDIFVEAYDSDNHKLFPSDNWVVKIDADKTYFRELGRSKNGSYIRGSPIKFGLTEVTATLIGTKDLSTGKVVELETPLHASAEMNIFEPIVLKPSKSIFPWDPVKPTSEQVPYTIESTSGMHKGLQFTWLSGDSSIAAVTQNGVARTTGTTSGKTQIVASMSRATHNKGSAEILVLPALDVNILKKDIIFEAEVGQTLDIPVAFYADYPNREQPFTKCIQLNYRVILQNQDSFSVVSERGDPMKIDHGCTSVKLKAHNAGFAEMAIRYKFPQTVKPQILQDTIYLAAFNALVPLQPSSGTTLLALDSSLQIAWSGGPNPWTSQRESHFAEISIGVNGIVDVNKITPSLSNKNANVYVYETKCLKLGETTITLKVGHKTSTFLPHPIVSTSTVTVVCGQPEKVQLKADIIAPEYESKCPLMAQSGRIATQSYEDLKIRALVYDKSDRRFDNISTLNLAWKVSDDELASLSGIKGIMLPDFNENKRPYLGYKVANAEMAHQILHTKDKPGSLDVTVELQKSNSWTAGFSNSLKDTLPLNLRQDAEINPQKLTIFHHPSNNERVDIQHGSGFFEVGLAHEIALHEYNPEDQSINIIPKLNGETKLVVKDLCLRSKQAAMAEISVVGVHRVELLVDDKVQKGNSITAKVRLVDQNGSILRANSKLVDVTVVPSQKINENILTISKINKPNSEEIFFNLKGKEVGTIAINAIASTNVTKVKSTSKSVQVFPPISLDPRNITLLIGSKFQILANGGPNQPDSQVEYSIENKGTKIANANSIGVITGMTLGSTKITGRIMGLDKISNEKIVVSEDTVNVHVVKLDGIKISSPIVKMKVNTEIPLAATGSSDPFNQNAFAFGSAFPRLRFHWSINNAEVAELRSVFHANGVSNDGAFNTASIRLKAKKPGRVLVKLKAKITSPLDANNQFQFDRDSEFHSQIAIQVYEDFSLNNPNLPSIKRSLLMEANSEYQLKTTHDGNAKILSYHILPKVNGLKEDIVTVSEHGIVRSGNEFGACVILAKVVEDFGVVQQLSIVVEVKPVTFMMQNAIPVFDAADKAHGLSFIPRGVSLPIELSFHDETGSKFDSVSMQTNDDILVRPSRFDTNQIQRVNSMQPLQGISNDFGNDTISDVHFVMEVVKERTFTVLKAAIEQSKSKSDQTTKSKTSINWQDFVVLDVQRAIQPPITRATVGDVLGLQSQINVIGVNEDKETNIGEWMAEPKGIIDIDETTGLMTALRHGQVRILYLSTKDKSCKTSVDLEIKPPGRLMFVKDKSSKKILTNNPDRVQYVPLVLIGKDQQSSNYDAISDPTLNMGKNFHSIRENIPSNHERPIFKTLQSDSLFICNARFLSLEHKLADYLEVKGGFDTTSGTYGCYFTPTNLHEKQIDLSATVELTVTPRQALLSYLTENEMGDKLQLPFATSFKALTQELSLTNVEPMSSIELKGISTALENINVELSHPHLLKKGRPYTDSYDPTGSDIGGYLQKYSIPISVKPAFWNGDKESMNAALHVIVSSDSQSIRIPIVVRFRGDQCGNIELGWSSIFYFMIDHYQSLVITAVSCLVCTYITKVIYCHYIRKALR